MAIKKSDLYSSLWASCDELRGGMDASQYKDYVLFMLFIKYISDKYADSDDFAPPVNIPKGAGFADMVALKGNKEIGDKINTQVIGPLVRANPARLARTDFPDFNDANKLGEGNDLVEKVSNLIAIFSKPELDFSKNRAEHDDILGDAYEYLMRHFATESGKSKGQFYTPSEVSRVMAKVIGISPANTVASTTAYDPTCGSGSLLLKVAEQAGKPITLEGQEKDVTTAGLARMNMILHNFTTANIQPGNTLANPKFLDGAWLRTYDYVVANPPFSDKKWITGMTPASDPFERFGWGAPPDKQGDYAYLLHIIRSMKSTGKGACILPHGVLFRGNAEALIRKELVLSGYLKAIIGLPANLFYGTGIPACILVLDKENARARKGIFMIDASQGFMKDGPKNRLREQDIHKIVDAYSKLDEIARYCRMVPHEEIADPRNDYNLNLPRYIDSSAPEDIHDIAGHLYGGIPDTDIAAMGAYWRVLPGVRATLFQPGQRPGYSELRVPLAELKASILGHAEFTAFNRIATAAYHEWRNEHLALLRTQGVGSKPKDLIHALSENLLESFKQTALIDAYDIYQHLMQYWEQTMQDDCYQLAADGWHAAAQPQLIQEDKAKKLKIKPDFVLRKKKYLCELLPPTLLIARWYADEQAAIDALEAEVAVLSQELEELAEEHAGEDGVLAEAANEKGKITRASVAARLRAIRGEADVEEERKVLAQYLTLVEKQSAASDKLSEAQDALTAKVAAKYPKLSEEEIKVLVVQDKWLAAIEAAVQGELDRVSQTLTGRIRQLAERYATPLPALVDEVAQLSALVAGHLKKMGFAT